MPKPEVQAVLTEVLRDDLAAAHHVAVHAGHDR